MRYGRRLLTIDAWHVSSQRERAVGTITNIIITIIIIRPQPKALTPSPHTQSKLS